MSTLIPVTQFAPAECIPIEVVYKQAAALGEALPSKDLLNSVLNYVFILNQQRQIVFASRNCEHLLRVNNLNQVIGKRPGEVLNCQHKEAGPGGCGTSEYCRECGAVLAILESLKGQKSTHEVRLTRVINCTPESMDLLVYAVPFSFKGEMYSIFSVADISHEKRRRALESIFFHDVVNYAGGLEGLANELLLNAPPHMQGDLELMHQGLKMLTDEIYAQRDLVAAEVNDLRVHLTQIRSGVMLGQLAKFYQNHEAAKDRRIDLWAGSTDVEFQSDITLLKRVLGNMLKNALEATVPGGIVILACEDAGNQIRFWVRNSGVIPGNIQRQIFKRSFTTKSSGRGLGAYSVKLLVEKYLHGTASFTSTAEQGTVFYVSLPKRGPGSSIAGSSSIANTRE